MVHKSQLSKIPALLHLVEKTNFRFSWWRKHSEVWTEILFDGENPVLVWIFFEISTSFTVFSSSSPSNFLRTSRVPAWMSLDGKKVENAKRYDIQPERLTSTNYIPSKIEQNAIKVQKKWEIQEDWPQQSTSRQRRHLALQQPLQQRKTFQPERRQCFPGHMSASCLLVKTIEFNYLQTWSV